LDISHNETRNIIATGECGKFSTVHVWDTTTMKSIAQFNLGDKAKGVACVAISPCQRYVVASD
jgi:WD40 repeat protein